MARARSEGVASTGTLATKSGRLRAGPMSVTMVAMPWDRQSATAPDDLFHFAQSIPTSL